jgi:membrane protein implicated in regulation of membrane protease activity
MALDPTARRRWFGAVVLVIALAMLICGETLLQEKLGDLGFLLYWLTCLVFTGLAILVALADARALQRQTRKEQRDLFESTLTEIEKQARAKPSRSNRRRNDP